MVTLDKVVQVIRVGSDGVFQVLRSTFIDTTMLNLRNYHLRITKVSSGKGDDGHCFTTKVNSLFMCALGSRIYFLQDTVTGLWPISMYISMYISIYIDFSGQAKISMKIF